MTHPYLARAWAKRGADLRAGAWAIQEGLHYPFLRIGPIPFVPNLAIYFMVAGNRKAGNGVGMFKWSIGIGMQQSTSKTVVCMAEDRENFDTGIQLSILSLAKHSPKLPIYLFYPQARNNLVTWLQKHPQVTYCPQPLPDAYGWNVKPQALLHLLDLGYDEVVWIDTDIIVTRDISSFFNELDDSTLVITEESVWGLNYDRENPAWELHRDPGVMRAALWQFEPGRRVRLSLNACIIRITARHRALLMRWYELLQLANYKHVQQLGWQSRPLHMLSDQDVLTALLASRTFSDIPLKVLRRGNEILQFMGLSGFTVRERARSLLHGLPAFIHSQAGKPWIVFHRNFRTSGFGAYARALYIDMSPYTLVARRYRNELEGDTNWMAPHFLGTRVFRAMGFYYAPLIGLPIAIVADIARMAWRLSQFFRRLTNSFQHTAPSKAGGTSV